MEIAIARNVTDCEERVAVGILHFVAQHAGTC